MKIRTGFVSNSSSSSFVIYGRTFMDRGSMLEALKKKYGNESEIPGIELADDGSTEYIDTYAFGEETGLYMMCDEDSCIYLLGRDFLSLEQDETRRHFEKETDKILEDFIGPGHNSLEVGSTYNG